MKSPPLWASILFLVLGIIFITAGVVIYFIAPTLIENQVLEGGIIDSQDHSGYEEWRKPPENPLVYSCYFWNISNIDAVRNGTNNGNTKPFLQNVGPYVYKRFQERFDVSFLNDDETPCSSGCPKVQYREWGDYVYFPDESNNRNPETDQIYVPNVAYWTLLIGGNNLEKLSGRKLSEEILAIEGGRGALFGGFNQVFVDDSFFGTLLGLPGMSNFSMNFLNAVGPLFSVNFIATAIHNIGGSPSFEVAQAIVLNTWAYCARSENLALGECTHFTAFATFFALNSTQQGIARNVLSSPFFSPFRFNSNTNESAEAIADFDSGQLQALWNDTNDFSLGNSNFQVLWLSPSSPSTFISNWDSLYNIDTDIGTRIASWRTPFFPDTFNSGLFYTVEYSVTLAFFPGESPADVRDRWGFLHWGRWDVPSLPNFANGGIFNGNSLSDLDSATGQKVFFQKLEINLWAGDVSLPQVNFNYTLSRKIIETFAVSTPDIYGHIVGFEGLIAVTGSDANAALAWPTGLNPLLVPTAGSAYSLSGDQARLLYHYLKTFFLKNIVDPTLLLPISVGGFGQTQLPGALFRSTPHEQLFGRMDPLFTVLAPLFASKGTVLDPFVPGVWSDFEKDTVASDPLTLDLYNTGKGDPKNRGQQLTYETKTDLSELVIIQQGLTNYTSPRYYDIEVPVRGSSLTFVGPFRLVDNKNDQDLLLWVPNVVRELKLIFQEERKLKGIPVNRYIADRFYTTVVQSPEGEFNNPFNFVMNLKRAYTKGQVDIFLTFPHFTLVNEANLFVDPLDGDLQPNEEEYILFWDIEPITGLAFAARAPLQVAVGTVGSNWQRNDSANFVFDRWSKDTTRNTYFPIYYITRTNQLTDDQADQWKSGVQALMVGRLAALAAGVAVGGLLLILGVVFIVAKAKGGKGDMDEFELRT